MVHSDILPGPSSEGISAFLSIHCDELSDSWRCVVPVNHTLLSVARLMAASPGRREAHARVPY